VHPGEPSRSAADGDEATGSRAAWR
jgi:hypothetical protein